MWHSNRWIVAILIIVSLQLVACGQTPGPESSPPARVERLGQTGFSRVILTAQATKRIGIETGQVSDVQFGGKRREVVPYSAVFYDLNGKTWVYTNPEPLTFVRAHITVDQIDGEGAILSEGPPPGTVVVTVGAPELYGTEFGIGQ